MPSEPLPIDRKEFLKDRKPASSEPVEIAPSRWRDSPTTPSSHCYNHVYGSSSFRRPIPGHVKPIGGNLNTTSVESLPRVFVDSVKNNEVLLGSSHDWKPVKWIRSGSLSSRGSNFSHLSSCKIVGVDSFDTKMEGQNGNITLVQSPSGDAGICVTPMTPDEVNSRKKPRLGWGEGLAKYEKKKVDPVDPDDIENGSSPSSLTGKSPSLTGNSESVSPTTSCSFACSLSPGSEEKTSITATTIDNDTCNANVALSQNQTHESTFNLETLDLTDNINLSQSVNELLQTDDTSVHGSGFAMNKLHVWKSDISRTLEVTESEVDSLEHELKSDEDSSTFPPAFKSPFKPRSNKNTERSEKPECSQNHVCRDDSQVSTGGNYTVSVGGYVNYDRKNRLHDSIDSIYSPNKLLACSTSNELNKLLPTSHIRTSVSRPTDDSEIKKKVIMRNRFAKFKERVTTLKFRTLQYAWKENINLNSVKSGAKLQKKFESNSRMGYADYQKHRGSNHSRLFSAGSSSLVPTKEVVEYVNMLLSDSQVKIHKNEIKMPIFILNKKDRMSSKFISDNGLVENPIDVEKERSIIKSWTVEDKQTFLEKYSSFGKNFRKIASFFPHKTVADCVEFYYKHHKSDLFQQMKKKSKLANEKSVNTNNTYLVTSGKRQNRETGPTGHSRPTGPTSLDMLGAASEMVANVDGQRSKDYAIYCNDQETVAADVLAGICGSISSEAFDSCITSSVDHQKAVGGCSKRRLLNHVDEETCSDDSCGEEINSSVWSDEEKSCFVKALRSYGKDFPMISRCLGTRSSDQCKLFFSKARKCLNLDDIDLSDQDDTCMVDSGSGSGSGIFHEKFSIECKMEVEESDSRSDRNLNDCEVENKFEEKGINGNLEGAADSEAANMDESESPQNTSASDSASGAKVEDSEHVLRDDCLDLTATTDNHGNNLDLNANSESIICNETVSNGFMMSNLFPQEPERKTDVSSRLTFRKSGQRSSSIDGYQLDHLHKRAQTRDEPRTEFKLDESLFLPKDGCLQMGSNVQQPKRSSSLDIEKPSKSGDLKLFGQIITNHSVAQKCEKKPDADTRSNLRFNDNEVQLKSSYGFWDGSRIQTGLTSLPGSAMLLAKYPAAFSNGSTLSKLDQNPHQHEQCNNNLTVVPGFQTRKLSNNNCAITVGGMNVVSDPVAAIRLHYAKTEEYKNGGGESWRNNVTDR